VGTEQLVGTIEEVETHDPDPTTSPTPDPWETVSDDFRGLLDRLKEAYRSVSQERGPSEDEVREAFGILLAAWDKVAETVTGALSDPEVRDGLRSATSSLATALGATVTQLGEELRRAQAANPGSSEEE
jgi:hypothetical protein